LKLPSSQLATQLERGLSGIYLIAADEPLLVAEATDEIRRAGHERGFEERTLHFVERGFRWDSVRSASDSLSLFSAKRIVEFRMSAPRPGDAGARLFRELAEARDPERLVIISIQARLDAAAQRSVWVKTIEKHGVVVDVRSVARPELPRFIMRRAERKGLTIGADAAELLADRVEGNLLAADQELTKLALISEDGCVDTEGVLAAVATSARYDVFRLSDAVIGGDLERALRVLAGLRTEGVAPALVVWALAREIMLLAQLKHAQSGGQSVDRLMERLRIWRSRQAAIRGALARYSDPELGRLLGRAASVDRTVKGLERAPVWEAITGLVLDLLAPCQSPGPA
jgi:DNA polymerase-3 subunit delta